MRVELLMMACLLGASGVARAEPPVGVSPTPLPAPRPAPEPWTRSLRFGAALSAAHFQQQAKTEIGGVRGSRLVRETSLGLLLDGAFTPYPRWPVRLGVGLFVRGDTGVRRTGRFVGFDTDGAAVTDGALGGRFSELWLGPLLRAALGPVFIEAGWAPLGLRSDGGRDDLPADDGSTGGLLSVTPSVAYRLALGADVPLDIHWGVTLRLAYRVRYYLERGGMPLVDDSALGSQDLAPFIGLRYRP